MPRVETEVTDQDLSPREQIVAILSKETGIEPERLTADATIHDLGIQSIDLVQAIFAIETRFDIEIPPGLEGEGATVDDFVKLVLSRLGPAPAGAS